MGLGKAWVRINVGNGWGKDTSGEERSGGGMRE